MRKTSLRVGAAMALIGAVALVPTAAQGTTPTPPPYPVTSPYIVGAQTKTPIQHLIVIFQENVSFDHYFGTYPDALNPAGEPTFTPQSGTPVPNNYLTNPSLLTSNPNKDASSVTINPFRLDRSQAVTCDQDHNYNDEQKMFDGNSGGTAAAMDKFVTVASPGNGSCTQLAPNSTDKGSEIMGYFDGNTVTALWNLANRFAMSDNSFSTTFGPSTPGALNLAAGQTSNGGTALANNVTSNNGFGGTCTTSNTNSTACTASGNYSTTSNAVVGDPDPLGDDCANSTRTQVNFTSSSSTGPLNIGDLLSAKNISWGWFQGGFRPTSVSMGGTATCGSKHQNLAGNFVSDYNPHHEPFQYFPTTANPHHVSVTNPDMIGQNDTLGINHEYDESDFYTALQANNLPAVTFLKGANYQDGHAGFTESDPLGEQTFISDVVDAVEQSPAWASTAIVVMYDDSDGWYDHVFHAPVNPSADSTYDFLNGGVAGACGTPANGTFPLGGINDRCGPGPRQPLLVISPWAKQNYVDHNFTDQSSVIKFIEENWGINGLGDNAFESLSGLTLSGGQNPPTTPGAGDLMSMFDFNAQDERAPAINLNDQTGEIIPQNQGAQGQQGPQGQQGQQGPAGQNGSNGANGSNGTNGAAGAQGPKGDQGQPGNTPHVVCHVTVHGRKITVTCVQTNGARDARASRRASARITRGRTVFASGSGPVRRFSLAIRRPLRHGFYLLEVRVRGAALDLQVIHL